MRSEVNLNGSLGIRLHVLMVRKALGGSIKYSHPIMYVEGSQSG